MRVLPIPSALPCISCGRDLPNIGEDVRRDINQPSGGVAFSSPGHYGSKVFDPMDGSALEINVCDQCLSRVAQYKAILLHRPGRKPTFWKDRASVDRSGEAGETPKSGSTEGESAVAKPDAQTQPGPSS